MREHATASAYVLPDNIRQAPQLQKVLRRSCLLLVAWQSRRVVSGWASEGRVNLSRDSPAERRRYTFRLALAANKPYSGSFLGAAPLTPASERLQSLATANRLLTATTKTAPPRKSTRFAMIRVTSSPM